MKTFNNLELFDYCLNNPEPVIDEFYLKSGNLLISTDPKKPTTLMKKNMELLECISAFNFARKNKNRATKKDALERILKIVKSKNINYSEFISFWPVVDISYSLYKKLSEQEQMEII